ncbi:MAG: P1 family peptidase [Gaiellales bacterium]
MSAHEPGLPEGFAVGHWSDSAGLTGCTVVLCPTGSVSACVVAGGAPGTRETDLLAPAASQPGANAILLTGGSAFGLAASDGVVAELETRGIGFPTPAGPVPLVAAAVVYDLGLGSATARPGADAGTAAVRAATADPPERGSVGAGLGCSVGKLLGPDGSTKGGVGLARGQLPGGGSLAALAVVNAFGEVLAEDGTILAGAFDGARYRRTVDLLAGDRRGPLPLGQATTLACVLTDARLTKLEAWLVARASTAGIARAVDPAATAMDGDVAFCVAGGKVEVEPVLVCALAADAVAQAIRDAVREARGVPGCPSASDRAAEAAAG